MKIEVRNDCVVITGYVNAVERLSKPIRENLHGKVRTFLERIRAGVFHNALKRNDNVLVLLNHDENRVLASTADGNAVLEEDNIGLRAEITITDEEVVQKARDGKLSGWSFGFVCLDDVLTTEGNDEIRTVTDLELLEVSILDDTKRPAYYGTSIETREGGARMKEIRVESIIREGEDPQTISIEELADLVASKVIEALKAEVKAEEEVVEDTEDTEDTEGAENTEGEEGSGEEVEDQENRADYSAFEARLAKLKGEA